MLVLAFLSSCSLLTTVTGSSYYVAAPDGAPCPRKTLNCQELSFYTNQSSVYFTSNSVFFFLEGHHFLGQEDAVNITGVRNLTLQGLGTMEAGPHETVMESTVVINCNNGGFTFTETQFVTIEAITLNGCTGNMYFFGLGPSASGLGLICSHNFRLLNVSVQNSSGYGVLAVNSFNLTIEDSSFYRNQYPTAECTSVACQGGNAVIVFNDYCLDETSASFVANDSMLNIAKTNFSLSFGRQFELGSGLMISVANNKYDYRVDIDIDNILAYGNSGTYGANIHIAIGSRIARYKIDINNTRSLYGNAINHLDIVPGLTRGAGLYFDHIATTTAEATLIVYNSEFSHNQAGTGGGMYIAWDTNTAGLVICNTITYFNNTADISSALFILGTNEVTFLTRPQQFYLNNINIDRSHQLSGQLQDSSLQSAVSIQNVVTITFTDLLISNSLGTGLTIFGSTVTFLDNENIIINNTGINGGGMAVYGNSYIFLNSATLYLTNNHALRNGGGMFVSQPVTPIAATCFYQVSNLNFFVDKIIMSNNTAQVAGSALYGGNNLTECTPGYLFSFLFDYTVDQPGQTVISSDPVKVCLCTELNEVNCGVTEYFTSSVPGRQYSIPVCTVGNMDGLTPGVIAANFSSSNNTIMLENTAAECRTLSYTLMNTNINQTQAIVTFSLENVVERISQTISQSIVATIEIQECPLGFNLDMISGICECSDQLRSIPGVSCDILSEAISRQTGGWIGHNNATNCTLTSKTCPLDFCQQGSVTFTMNDPDIQCAMNRSGVLCGGCDEGLSLLLGTNKCGQCSNAYLTLLLPFALAGIALVAILIALNLTVSVGAINGLIFYANIVKIQESFFFPNGPVPVLSQFISWINLDLGIEVCFFDGLKSCTKAWFQFLFPLYVWLILILIIILARFSKRLLRLVGSQIVPVLATLLLLSYTKLIRSVIQSLYITEIANCMDQQQAVWFIDGNIRYFTGCHLPLVIVASAVLIFLILPYTLFLLASPVMESYLTGYKCFRWVVKLKPVLDAYGGPYHDKYRVWTGVLVLVRLVLALITSLSDSVSISISALVGVAVLLITIHCIARDIYRKWQFGAVEVVFLSNLILLGYTVNRRSLFLPESVGIIVLLSISLVLFLGIVLYHILLRLKLESKLDPVELYKRISKTGRKRSANLLKSNQDDVITVRSHREERSGCHRESLLLNSDFHQFIDDN